MDISFQLCGERKDRDQTLCCCIPTSPNVQQFLKAIPCFGFCFWFVVPWLWVLPALGCDEVRPACKIQFLNTVCRLDVVLCGFFYGLKPRQKKGMDEFLGKSKQRQPTGGHVLLLNLGTSAGRALGWLDRLPALHLHWTASFSLGSGGHRCRLDGLLHHGNSSVRDAVKPWWCAGKTQWGGSGYR